MTRRLLSAGDSPARAHGSVAVGGISALVLCLALPAVVVPSAAPFSFDVPMALFGVVALSGLRLAWLVYRGDQRLAEAIVWLFAYVFLGLAPIVQLRTAIDPNTTPDIWRLLDEKTAWIVLVGLLAFLLGVTRPRGEARPAAPAELSEPRARILAATGLVFAAYVTATIGFGPFFSSRVDLDLAMLLQWPDATTRAIIRALSTYPLLVAALALLQLRRRAEKPSLSTSFTIMLLLAALCVHMNPISSPRYVFGTALLALMTAAGLVATRARFRATVLAALAGILVVFPFADYFRYSATGQMKATGIGQALTTGDFDAFAQINNALMYVSTYGTTGGRQALGVLLFWVPRSMWPGKPVDTGILLAEFRGYGFTNLSAPLWAELYVNGGWVVLALGMTVFGLLIRRWDSRTLAGLNRAPGVLGCVLPFYLLLLLRGSLLQATVGLAVILACYSATRAGSPLPVERRRVRPGHLPVRST